MAIMRTSLLFIPAFFLVSHACIGMELKENADPPDISLYTVPFDVRAEILSYHLATHSFDEACNVLRAYGLITECTGQSSQERIRIRPKRWKSTVRALLQKKFIHDFNAKTPIAFQNRQVIYTLLNLLRDNPYSLHCPSSELMNIVNELFLCKATQTNDAQTVDVLMQRTDIINTVFTAVDATGDILLQRAVKHAVQRKQLAALKRIVRHAQQHDPLAYEHAIHTIMKHEYEQRRYREIGRAHV